MAADLAELGIKVDSSQVSTATGRLNAFSGSAARAEGFTLGLSRSSKQLAKTLGAAGLAGTAAALGTAFVQSIQKGRQFTSQLSELEAITGIAGNALEVLSENALETSAQTGRSATEIVESYKLVASQLAELIDFDTASGQDVLRGVAEDAVTLSQAAGIDLKQAVEATTTSINQFNLSAEASTDVINNLAAGSKYGAAEVANIQAAMQEAGSAAAAANEDITTTNAAIQVLAANAITGSKAGTGLRNVFLRLMTESNKLAEMGLGNVNLKADGLLKTLEKLNPIANDSAALTKIFGQEAFNAASLLIRNRDALASLESKLGDTNTATEQAAIQMDNLDGDIARLAKTVNKDLIESFQNGESSFRELVQQLTLLWEEFGDDFIFVLDKITRETTDYIGIIKDALNDELTVRIAWEDMGKLPKELRPFMDGISKENREAAQRNAQAVFDAFRAELENQPSAPVDDLITINHDALITEIEATISSAKREAERTFQDEPILIGATLSTGHGSLTDEQLLSQVEKQFEQFERLGSLFDDYDVGAQKAKFLRNEIERLVRSGDEHTATISRLKTMYEQWTGSSITGVSDLNGEATKLSNQMSLLQDVALTIKRPMEDFLGTAASEMLFFKEETRMVRNEFGELEKQTYTLQDRLGELFNSLLRDLSRTLTQLYIIKPLMDSIYGFMGIGSGSGGVTTGSASTFDGSITNGGNFGDAYITDDGTAYGFDSADKVLAMKDFSPLVEGIAKRSGRGSGGDVKVIINNNSGEEVQTKRRRTPGGGREIEVMIGNTVKKLFNEGKMDSTMNSNYGIGRQGF